MDRLAATAAVEKLRGFPCDTIRDEKKCLESYMKYRSGEYYQCGVRKAGFLGCPCTAVFRAATFEPKEALVTELPEDAEQYEPELEEDTELIPAEEASPQSIEEDQMASQAIVHDLTQDTSGMIAKWRRMVLRQRVNEIYAGEWEATVNEAQNDVFLTSVVIGLDDDTSPNEDASQNVKNPSNAKLTPNVNKFKNDSGKFVKPKTFMSEIYTTTQRVTKAAQQRGHVTGSPLSLETGWNFLRSHDREVARKLLSKEIPYFLVIAFPCSFWSILLNLNPPKDHERRLKEAMQLLRFAIQLARDQHARGLHFVLENPQSSRAWSLDEMQKALSALQARLVDFHQCRFGLRGRNGQLVRKATRLATSSDYIVQTLDGMKCLGNHDHEHVIGGAHISRPSGHYPWELAKTLVKGMERQFEADFKRPHPGNLPGSPHSTLAVEEGEAEHYPEMVAGMSRALTPGAEGAFGSSTRRSSSVMRPSFDLSQSPFPQTLQKALLQAQERATEVPVPEAGNKRSAELDAEQLREEVQEADEIPPPATSVTAPQSSEVLNVTALPYEVMELQAKAELHPLRQLQALAAMDRRDPLGSKVLDHGTWRGDWFTFACLEGAHALTWRSLEEGIDMRDLKNLRASLGTCASKLISCFSTHPIAERTKAIQQEAKLPGTAGPNSSGASKEQLREALAARKAKLRSQEKEAAAVDRTATPTKKRRKRQAGIERPESRPHEMRTPSRLEPSRSRDTPIHVVSEVPQPLQPMASIEQDARRHSHGVADSVVTILRDGVEVFELDRPKPQAKDVPAKVNAGRSHLDVKRRRPREDARPQNLQERRRYEGHESPRRSGRSRGARA
ncbi:Copia protein [Durusdinium trenchii]|uniref:Copia protein n=1 Tax=Durusdinium trenchii TaxID=1381693 RepID=A0ABP0SKP2_9DINO